MRRKWMWLAAAAGLMVSLYACEAEVQQEPAEGTQTPEESGSGEESGTTQVASVPLVHYWTISDN